MQQVSTGVKSFILWMWATLLRSHQPLEERGGDVPALRVLSTEVRDDVENSGVGTLRVII